MSVEKAPLSGGASSYSPLQGAPPPPPPTPTRSEKKPLPVWSYSGTTLESEDSKDQKPSCPEADHLVGGTGGRETGRKGGGRCTGGGRRGGGKRDSQGGGKREKKGKITQHCAMLRNRKNAKGREPKNTGREPGLKGTGSGRFKPPCPSPPPTIWLF